MAVLKFLLNKDIKSKKNYKLILTKKNKSTKYNTSLNLGKYSSSTKIYNFDYPKIITLLKMGNTTSKQYPLISFFYLKQLLKKIQ